MLGFKLCLAAQHLRSIDLKVGSSVYSYYLSTREEVSCTKFASLANEIEMLIENI